MASGNYGIELDKLKVADLKKELKARGLSTIGNKSELVERLQDVLTTGVTEHADDDVNEDEVLGDDELLSETDKSGELLIAEDVILSPDKTPKLTVIDKKEKENTGQLVNVAKPPSPPPPPQQTETTAAAQTVKLIKKPVKITGTAVKILSSQERLDMRAKRFSTTTTEDARKKARAERFGMTVKSNAGANSNIGNSMTSGLDKLKQRANRFGISSSESMKKLDETDRLRRRKDRFGAVVGGTKVTLDLEERKKKRAERFGLQ